MRAWASPDSLPSLVSVSHNIFVKSRGRVQTRQVSQELPGAGSHAVMCPATVPRQLGRVSFITVWISFVMTLLYCCTHTTQTPQTHQTLQTPECLISSEQVAGQSSWAHLETRSPNLDLILIFILALYCSLIWLLQTLALFPRIKTKWRENNHNAGTGNLSLLNICDF